ncbi:MAG: hypothetical protein H6Q60_1503 [Oscillospiraceae bacterium]|nr:hypothetical protein [Oscillospiraceae bacterium]
MSKRYSVLICVLFCGFLGLIALAHLFMPDKEFSETENRYLTELTDVKTDFDSIVSGEMMSEFETYLTDQFPLRDSWISAKTLVERLSGKQENNGVYFGSQDTLITQFDEPDWDEVDQNLSYVQSFAEQAEIPVYFSLIPGKVTVWADRLPDNAPNADEDAVISRGEAVNANWVDMEGSLEEHSDESIYYRTDHHWTSLGAYYGYTALMRAMNIEPVLLSDYQKTTVSTSFFGTTYSKSGVRWISPDSIDVYVPADGISVTSYATGSPVESGLYVDSFLSKKDKYSMFLGGNTPLCVIKTGLTDAPKLLIIRDSYTDSLAPFLTAHFSEIHLVDLRYYNSFNPKDYIQQNGIDAAAVLFSVDNFVSASGLFLLGT